MEEFSIIQFSTKRAPRIPQRTARIHNKKGSRLIAFSYDVSKEIRAAGVTHLNVVKSKLNGEYYFYLCNNGVIELKQNNQNHEGIVARNAEAVEFLMSIFSDDKNRSTFDLKLSENKSANSNALSYHISK